MTANSRHATILAFDGVVADTMAARVRALDESLRRFSSELKAARSTRAQMDDAAPPAAAGAKEALPGRTFAEATRLYAHGDETLAELIAFDAAQRFDAAMLRGVAVAPALERTLRSLATRGPVVLRADSERRVVDRMLTLGDLGDRFNMVICSDEVRGQPTECVAHGAYRAVDARLSRMAVPIAHRLAVEPAALARTAAGRFVHVVTSRLEEALQ